MVVWPYLSHRVDIYGRVGDNQKKHSHSAIQVGIYSMINVCSDGPVFKLEQLPEEKGRVFRAPYRGSSIAPTQVLTSDPCSVLGLP